MGTMTVSPKYGHSTLVGLVERAEAAGHAAAMGSTPTPMVVSEHENMFNDASPVKKAYYVPDGVCGFAWVNVRPGTSRLAKYLKETGKGRTDSYEGGVKVWVSAYGQSMTRKEAYAHAYAAVLSEAGFKAYAGSRMD